MYATTTVNKIDATHRRISAIPTIKAANRRRKFRPGMRSRAAFASRTGPSKCPNHQSDTGPTPFISNVAADLSGDNGGTLQSVAYVIYTKTGSYTRPFVGSYTGTYLAAQGYLTGTTVTIPVIGLYAGSSNSVEIYFLFSYGRNKFDYGFTGVNVTTAMYLDPCNRLNDPAVTQKRSSYSALNFDYFLLKNTCSSDFPAILDTDANVRWVGTTKISSQSAILFQNGIYTSDGGSGVNRTELDGRSRKIGDYASYGVTYTGHHNYDPGRNGIVIEVNTTA